MENKFFLHRIRKDNGTYTAGIEVHDTLDAAIQSFHGQMKMAYNNSLYPNTTFVSCMVTDEADNIVPLHDETWSGEDINDFYVHYIRHDGNTYTKGIEVCPNYAAALRSFHTHMEYGYGNSKFPNVTFVACKVVGASGAVYKQEGWVKPSSEEI